MRRIVFTSRATKPLSRNEVSDLCQESASRNKHDHVTGLFLYDGARFLQALEGEPTTLSKTMERITRDGRHFDIINLVDEGIIKREFAEWTMSQPMYGIGDNPQAYMDKIKRDVANVSDANIKAQFIGFASLARHARYRYA